jgi:hypothetical protein
MDTVTIGIAFKLPLEVKQHIEKLHNEIAANVPLRIATDYGIFYPHATIYHVKFPLENKDKVTSVVESIVKQTSPVHFDPIGINEKFNFVGIGFEKTDVIKDIHEKIVTELNPLREGVIGKKYIEKFTTYSEKERVYINTYGYPYVFDEYRPHVTVAYLEHGADMEEVKSMILLGKPFTVTELTINFSTKDENGNTVKEIKTLQFYENH